MLHKSYFNENSFVEENIGLDAKNKNKGWNQNSHKQHLVYACFNVCSPADYSSKWFWIDQVLPWLSGILKVTFPK